MNKVSRVKNNDFTTISNVFLRDKNLTLKAKGFLSIIMGLPDCWEFSINGICSIIKEGKTCVYNIIDELKKNKYCIVVTCRDEKGKITGNDYTFYEEPYLENPYMENPNMDNPYLENQPQLNTKEIKDINNKEEKDKSFSKKEQDEELFEQLWSAYNRKGNKKKAKEQWAKIPHEDKHTILPHLKVYVDCNETKYTKDFERYLKDKVYENVVYDKNDNVVYDPEYSTKYTPTGNNLIQWSEKHNIYICSDDFDYYDRNRIRDGYTDQNRPDGATIVLYGGRGTIQWCKETKKWEYVQK